VGSAHDRETEVLVISAALRFCTLPGAESLRVTVKLLTERLLPWLFITSTEYRMVSAAVNPPMVMEFPSLSLW